MPRLFVDCDDTIVKWDYLEGKEGLHYATGYEMNVSLIGDIDCWLDEHHDYDLIVWSGGGVEYAHGWARKAQFRHAFTILPKDMRTPEQWDICIDDMYGEMKPRDGRVRVLPPDTSKCPMCSTRRVSATQQPGEVVE